MIHGATIPWNKELPLAVRAYLVLSDEEDR